MSRDSERKLRQKNIQARKAAKIREHALLFEYPHTLLEHLEYWLTWRFLAANYFASWALPEYHPSGEPVNIMEAECGWYIPRFIQGLRFGQRGVRRAKRELRRLSKL